MTDRNKNASFFKECMADALLALMKEKNFEKITINDIVAKAGVARMTYFRHGRTKQELLTFKLVLLWERWAESHNVVKATEFYLGNSDTFFEFNYENREVLKLLYRNALSSVVLKAFFRIMGDTGAGADGSAEENLYRSYFYEYGLFGMLNTWILRDFKESVEEMGQIGHMLIK